MPEFPPYATPSPARVHPNARALIGHHPHWQKRDYSGGLYSKAHFLTCSYCGSIHPRDLFNLLRVGGSRLEECSKAEKRILITPNPIAGESVRMGSTPAPAFDRDHWPRSLRDRLRDPAAHHCHPTIGERLACHIERPDFEPAPPFIAQSFFLEHASADQWAAIEALAAQGVK